MPRNKLDKGEGLIYVSQVTTTNPNKLNQGPLGWRGARRVN
ncbi:MAG: hypothetical protein O4804_17630 [Trichodesmium sp. St11_bin5]|nr:hypothetical protein [Trichodesmium sp. St11_bin5]